MDKLTSKILSISKDLIYKLVSFESIKSIIHLKVEYSDEFYKTIKIQNIQLSIIKSFKNNSIALKKYTKLIDDNNIKEVCKLAVTLKRCIAEQKTFKKEELKNIATCNSLLNVFLNTPSFETCNETYKNFKKRLKKDNISMDFYFRGQQRFDYGLLPSIYRKIDIEDCIIDKTKLMSFFDKNLIKNYELLIGDIRLDKMISYFQHTLSFSPFLDITEKWQIAYIFALNNKEDKDYSKYDSALFIFAFPYRNNFKSLLWYINQTKINWIANKIYIDFYINSIPLFALDYKCFHADFFVSKNKTNDRMKYQKAAFFFPYKCTIINKQILLPFNKIRILKIKILKSEKDKIYKEIIETNSRYKNEYLLNPYLYIKNHFGK